MPQMITIGGVLSQNEFYFKPGREKKEEESTSEDETSEENDEKKPLRLNYWAAFTVKRSSEKEEA